jgi:hypothetical protein
MERLKHKRFCISSGGVLYVGSRVWDFCNRDEAFVWLQEHE